MKVYINYPQPHFTIHRSSACLQLHKHQKEDQRIVAITKHNLSQVLRDFSENRYRFLASREYNDLWLEINLDNSKQEEGVVHVIQLLLGLKYKPFERVAINEHC
jgi:hypothetical protein